MSLLGGLWTSLPNDIFWNTILPRCDIETRIAFKDRAPRVALPPLDPTFAAEMERYLSWRRDGPPLYGWLARYGYSYTIPYWKHGSSAATTWYLCDSTTRPISWPNVYLQVTHCWQGWSSGPHGIGQISWDQPRGTEMVIVVKKEDTQGTRSIVAKLFIPPSPHAASTR